MADLQTIDWGSILPGVQLPGVTLPSGGVIAPPAPDIGSPVMLPSSGGTGFLDSIQNIANSITGAARTYYQTQAELNALKAQSRIAQAQGANAVQAAQMGSPSPYLLLWGGLGLAALLVLTRK